MNNAPLVDDARARRNALKLAAGSALAGANASVIFATGSIIGATLAPSPDLATAAISIYVVGMAFGTIPNGFIARHFGRRTAFQFGAGYGALGGFVNAWAIFHSQFWVYCVGAFLCGCYASVAQSYRFAAADTASDAFKPRAVSWVMAGGVLAGFVGPQLVQNTMNLWAPYLFSASYVGQGVVALIAMAALSTVDIPKPPPAAQAAGRPLLEIARQPVFIIAALCGVVSYALMNLIMTSAPLAMKMCGHEPGDSNLAIQWHVVAMYLPSFFTGSLIARFGAGRVVAAGLLLTAAAAAIDLSGTSVATFWTGLIVLGVGWNFGFTGASALVLKAHRPEERNKVQSFNDLLVFGTMALGSFSSGKLLTSFGWDMVNYVAFPPVALALAALLVDRTLRAKNVA